MIVLALLSTLLEGLILIFLLFSKGLLLGEGRATSLTKPAPKDFAIWEFRDEFKVCEQGLEWVGDFFSALENCLFTYVERTCKSDRLSSSYSLSSVIIFSSSLFWSYFCYTSFVIISK